MDQLASLQQTTGDDIQRLIDNYKKDSASRKTFDYYQERLRRLEAYWNTFDITDSDIQKLHPQQANHPYFEKAYYDVVKAAYNEFKAIFTSNIDRLQQAAKLDPKRGTALIQTFQMSEESSSGSQKRRLQYLIDMLQRKINNFDETDGSRHFWDVNKSMITQYWAQIEAAHMKLIESNQVTSVDENQYLQIEETVQKALIRCAEEVERLTIPQQPQTSLEVQSRFMLPKVSLPKFDGDYLTWRQFFDLFTQMVDKQNMPKCQKMWYLKTNVTGEAEKLIRHLPLTEDSYESAWKMLQDRYNNKRMLTTALLNRLLQQPVNTIESANSIKALHDVTKECLQGLINLGLEICSWDPLIVHLLIRKLDRTTHNLYEQSIKHPKSLPSLDEFLSFLETRFHSLETLGNKGRYPDDQRKSTARSFTSVESNKSPKTNCPLCNGPEHKLYGCIKFLRLSPENRLTTVKKFRLCTNCLNPGHLATRCVSRNCTRCSGKHNTLLHMGNSVNRPTEKGGDQTNRNFPHKPEIEGPMTSSTAVSQNISASTVAPKQRSYVFLSTVVINIKNSEGTYISARALLDSGSQLNFITERLSKKLNIPEFAETMRILGIGEGSKRSNKRVNITLKSNTTDFAINLEAFVLRQITPNQPNRNINIDSWNFPNDLKLADPHFNEPGQIDLLLGAEVFHQLLKVGQMNIGKDLPLLQNTHFGWVVAGKMEGASSKSSICGISIDSELQDGIERFWNLEEVPTTRSSFTVTERRSKPHCKVEGNSTKSSICGIAIDNELKDSIEHFWKVEEVPTTKNSFTMAERRCENHFADNTIRNLEGRFIVRLPFKADSSALGASKNLALQRFNALEKRLARQENLKEQYTKFMEEYIRLGHMTKIDMNQIQGIHYFLPHHCVLKPDSTTTKLRVVFDASAKTSSNVSLNDILSTGPTIQDELFTTLLRFRLHRYVFTADIEKMYRQMLVHEEDRRFQLILWRNHPTEELEAYQLNTVTYGTTSAPYLATKCLQKLASEGINKYPLGSKVLNTNFYVDDVMTGSDSLTQTIEMRDQLNSLLKTAGLTLRKWCANDQKLLKNIPTEDVALQLDLDIDNTTQIKTLGQGWQPRSDIFTIHVQPTKTEKITKRTALSDISQLFDPLGFLGPVVITAKMFLQKLWTYGYDWDSPLPNELQTEWFKFRENLNYLRDVKIDRHIFAHRIPSSAQVHAFADASEKAYGAAIYIRAVNKDKIVTVRLLCAKSRVAPVKNLSIPRLELCAATMAAELVNRIKIDLQLESCPTFLWTDSEIVLAWINSPSSSFHTFVANRISTIQDLTLIQQWRHVGSKDNPADLISRGIPANKLASCNLWFYGPLFLHGSESSWPPPHTNKQECDLERKTVKNHALSAIEQPASFIDLIDHQNNFRRLQRVAAHILRYCHNLRASKKKELIKKSGPLRPTELYKALIHIIRHMQREGFEEDIKHLERFSETPRGSPITSLTPFLDEEGALRVGGRLEAASLSYEAKHPLLLPYSHPFTKMIMVAYHKENLHCGPQALLASIKQKFWPIKGKTIARSVVQQCIRCTRAKPKLLTQIMGHLPPHRVQPTRPFLNAGVDFCGPIKTHFKVRGKHPQKTYIAVFCCFSTKAVHLELVTDLSTNGFIAAMKRFIGRRGSCQHLYCDNATNFVGANNQLQEMTEHIHTQAAKEKIQNTFSARGIEFHFIPPRAPHFGGLWEAAVKSAKHLLYRCLGGTSLTYEELETIIIEIEAVLNSRPITSMSNNANDLMALTPGHFIIGEPLTNSIDPIANNLEINPSKQFKVISTIKKEFWKRWHVEYLNELQQRHKWQQKHENLLPGTLVIIKEDNCPIMKWPLGRVIQTYPGADGVVRVAEIQTATSILRRPIHRLAPLPVQTEDDIANPSSEVSEPQTPSFLATASETMQALIEDGEITEDNITALPPKKGIQDFEDGEISEDNITNPPPRKKRYNPFKASTVLLFIFMILPTIMCTEVNVSPFKTTPGIHYENLGTAHIISDQWDIVVYYELRPYWRELKWLNLSNNKLKDLCSKATQPNTCLTFLQQFQHLIQDINDNDELLQEPEARSKRGAINIVGNLANSLFGVLDSNYAKHMSQIISTIHVNEDHFLHLIRNQTSLVNSTANIIRLNEGRMEKQFNSLESELNTIVDQLNETNNKELQLTLTQLMLSHCFQMLLSATSLRKTQTLLLDLLTDVHHGKISANLIRPSQLQQEVANIKSNLPSTLQLPETSKNIASLYKLINAEGRIIGSHIIFKLSLPLITSEHYQLYKMIPVPVVMNKSFIGIIPSIDYMMINLHRTQYYTLSESEFNSCTQIVKNDVMCQQKHPISQKGSNISRCEFNLMNQVFDHSSCQLAAFTDEQYWRQLHQSNHWVYSLQSPVLVNIVCQENLTQIHLNNSGIITIPAGCSLKQDHLTIQGHDVYTSLTRATYLPTSNLTDIINTNKRPAHTIHHVTSFQGNSNELQLLQREIEHQKFEETLIQVKHTDTHQFIISYLAFGCTIALIGYIIYRTIRRHRSYHTKNPPIPAPRSHHDEAFVLHV